MSKRKPRSLFRSRVQGKNLHLTNMPDNPDGSQPKYLAKVEEFARTQGFGVGAHMIQVVHDDWCGIFENKPCDCDPEVKLHPDSPSN